MEIEEVIRNIVRDEIAEYVGANVSDPVLIGVNDAAAICGVHRSVIDEIIKESADNGFPSIRLGARTTKIDKARLNRWLATGGLGVKE